MSNSVKFELGMSKKTDKILLIHLFAVETIYEGP